MTLATLNMLIGASTILMLIVGAVLAVIYITREEVVERMVVRFALLLGFLLASAGVVVTLIYSEYFGVVPCGLCWFSRIFLYPQAVLFFIATWKRDVKIAAYSIALSIGGLIISLYHHYIQMNDGSALPCPASGGDCGKRIIFEFGFVTFPLVGAATFALIIILMLFVIRREREGKR